MKWQENKYTSLREVEEAVLKYESIEVWVE